MAGPWLQSVDGWAFLSENDDQLIFCRAAITHDMYLSLSQPIKHRKFIKILSFRVITNDSIFSSECACMQYRILSKRHSGRTGEGELLSSRWESHNKWSGSYKECSQYMTSLAKSLKTSFLIPLFFIKTMTRWEWSTVGKLIDCLTHVIVNSIFGTLCTSRRDLWAQSQKKVLSTSKYHQKW